MVEIELQNRSDFDGAVESGVVLVDFNAPWCEPCRAQEPILNGLEATFRGRALFAKVNIDKSREIALNLGIQSIPTIILFRGGKEVDRLVGLQSVDRLRKVLGRVLGDTSIQ